MKKTILLGVILLGATAVTQAGVHIGLGITIPLAPVVPPAVLYAPPTPVVYQTPAAVVYQAPMPPPPAVVYAPAPVVYAPAPAIAIGIGTGWRWAPHHRHWIHYGHPPVRYHGGPCR